MTHHDAEIHAEYTREYRRWANLLRPRCPTLKGISAVTEFYGTEQRVQTKIEWGCKVLKNGDVIHVRVERGEA